MTDKFHCVVYSRFMVIFLPESIYSVPAEIFYLLFVRMEILCKCPCKLQKLSVGSCHFCTITNIS